MKWTEHSNKPCAIAKSLGVVGDSWTLLILRNSFLGARRFEEFQEQLGLTRHLLADRLKKLVAEEVLKKVPYGENAKRYEYKLTPKGLDLYPVILALVNWGNTWMIPDGEQPLLHVHRDCGQTTRPVMSCSECGDALDPRRVSVIPGKPLQEMAEQMEAEQMTSELGYYPPKSH
ncbi:helix-turn-helix transcriptional regulator [Pseudomaricurvus alkylphenolicus]|uniref:winged helix-turn-helix transcriptional regulator n=1 Tax=Pseudomaricurvus alkylphenolicus TaxID=1306991 RepID=UPI00141DFDE0|nr:helix-turn-helix transcriptional regulator [Pseudomaricurvus alkylphenolicus]